MKKRLALMFLIVASVFTLVSCAPKIKSEKMIQEDLQVYLDSFSEPYVTISKLKVLERRTDSKAGEDTVCVQIDIENEDITGVLSYTMSYKLYEQGWMLDGVGKYSDEIWEMKPLQGPKQETVDKALGEKRNWLVFKEKNVSLEEGTSTFLYVNNGKTDYTTYEAFYPIEFTFDRKTGEWKNGKIEEKDRKYYWDIKGTWYPIINQYSSDWYEGYVMEIGDVSDDKVHVKVSNGNYVYFDEDVVFDDKNSAEFTVKTSNNYWNNLSMVIAPKFIGAEMVGTRSGCRFERR